MRKLDTKEERDRKRKRNQLIVGAVLIFLMFASTLGYAIQSSLGSDTTNTDTGTLEYNGFEFVYQNGFWVLGNFVFRYNPEQTPDLGDGLKAAQEYQAKPVYIQSDDVSAENEIYVNLGQIAERVQKACLNVACEEGLPVKSCTDNFIIIKESQVDRISQDEGCVYIEGKKEDLVKLVDQFLFKILGVK